MVKKHIALHSLSDDECQALIDIVVEQHGLDIGCDTFADVMLGLFEDIPGFETMPPAECKRLLNHLKSLYMSKKPSTDASTEPARTGESESPPVVVDLTQPVIRAAIEQGQSALAEGKTKADAARAIFGAIKGEPKEVLVAAFVEGANLTAKGALTYWYNCRRKAAKEAALSAKS
jgi:hypothetical protein